MNIKSLDLFHAFLRAQITWIFVIKSFHDLQCFLFQGFYEFVFPHSGSRCLRPAKHARLSRSPSRAWATKTSGSAVRYIKLQILKTESPGSRRSNWHRSL